MEIEQNAYFVLRIIVLGDMARDKELKSNVINERWFADMNNREVGGCYERIAAGYLEKQGLTILEYNFRCKVGEIDLIAQDKNYIVFVEVKYRRDREQGWAAEAVGVRKQRKIMKVAQVYLLKKFHTVELPCRFDVISIDGDEISWYKDAFWG